MKKVFITAIFAGAALLASAQAPADSTHLGDYTIKTKYKPNVQESHKVAIDPSLEEPKVSPPSYAYHFPAIDYKPKSVYSPIDPVYIKPEKPENLYDNYIELGGGNYLTSFLDASIHNTRDKYYTYGLKVKHHAASASKNPNQALFSDNHITAYGLREKGNDLYGEIDFRRNVVHYYGYLQDTSEMSLGAINQIYNDISAKMDWTYDKRKIRSKLGFNFNLFDKLGEHENTYSATSENRFKMGKQKLFIDLGATFTQLTETADYNRFFIDVAPRYQFKRKKVLIDLGFTGNYFLDSNTNKLYLAPLIKAETYLVPDKLRAYGSITGGLQKNTLRSLSYANPFLGQDSSYQNQRSVFKIAFGMNGNFKRFLEYGVTLSQEQVENQILFVNDTNNLRNFVSVYDDLSIFTLAGEMKFDVSRNIDLGFRGNVYAYGTDNEAEAWHLPSYDAALFATVRIADKIYVNGSFYATSNRKARNLNNETFDLGAINDANVGAEYRYKKNISAFLNINNILNQRYALWNHYNAQGMNILAGVTFSL